MFFCLNVILSWNFGLIFYGGNVFILFSGLCLFFVVIGSRFNEGVIYGFGDFIFYDFFKIIVIVIYKYFWKYIFVFCFILRGLE